MKKFIYGILERVAVDVTLYFLKVSSGFQTYLVTKLAEKAFEEAVVPLINYVIRKGYLYYDTSKGRIIAKKLQRARDDNNQDDYDRTVDRIFH